MKINFAGTLQFNKDSNASNFSFKDFSNHYAVDHLMILFTGYIANELDLPYTFDQRSYRSKNDLIGEYLAKAYSTWGSNLSSHIFGEYAIAIYDSVKRTLLLAHDTLGVLPLYFRQYSDRIEFASLLDDISRCNTTLDEEYIADYVCYGDHSGDRTPYLQIKRITPGYAILYSEQGLAKHHCWCLDDIQTLHYKDHRDYLEHCRHLVNMAIKFSLPSEGKVWIELSGGMDSSTVACTTAQMSGCVRLGSVSFVYPESKSSDESYWIESVNQRIDMPTYKIDGDKRKPFAELPEEYGVQPFHEMINFSLNKKYKKALLENQVDVVLTGMGGDAVFFGDGPEPFFFADILRKGQFLSLGRQIKTWMADSVLRRPARYWLERCAISPVVNHYKKILIQDNPPKISWINNSYILGTKRNGQPRSTWVPGESSVATTWFLERVLRSSNVLSSSDFRSTMGAEFRNPLMYLPLVKFMLSIPSNLNLSPSSDRVLHRASFTDILPESIVTRMTKSSPDESLYTGLEKITPWTDILTKPMRLFSRGYLDKTRWALAVDLAKFGRCESIKHFKAAATLEFWIRQFD